MKSLAKGSIVHGRDTVRTFAREVFGEGVVLDWQIQTIERLLEDLRLERRIYTRASLERELLRRRFQA